MIKKNVHDLNVGLMLKDQPDYHSQLIFIVITELVYFVSDLFDADTPIPESR